jgi:hypothetical protein
MSPIELHQPTEPAQSDTPMICCAAHRRDDFKRLQAFNSIKLTPHLPAFHCFLNPGTQSCIYPRYRTVVIHVGVAYIIPLLTI